MKKDHSSLLAQCEFGESRLLELLPKPPPEPGPWALGPSTDLGKLRSPNPLGRSNGDIPCTGTRCCRKCGERKTVLAFPGSRKSRSGMSRHCRECLRAERSTRARRGK